MKEKELHMSNIIYCDDLEKTIDRNGCYDAKGSTICKACLVKPVPKELGKINKHKAKG